VQLQPGAIDLGQRHALVLIPAAAAEIRPEIVAEIKFAEWTEGDGLRHAEFVTLCDDEDPKGVVRQNTV
jgi:ATP-dependent DNA ligase